MFFLFTTLLVFCFSCSKSNLKSKITASFLYLSDKRVLCFLIWLSNLSITKSVAAYKSTCDSSARIVNFCVGTVTSIICSLFLTRTFTVASISSGLSKYLVYLFNFSTI